MTVEYDIYQEIRSKMRARDRGRKETGVKIAIFNTF